MQRIIFNFLLALEGVNANKLRSFLTALGIIFGVGAVIAMLAIGSGAKQSILDQMKLIGTNNIVIESIVASGEEVSGGEQRDQDGNDREGDKRPYSPGLTMEDVGALATVLPSVEKISPEVIIPTSVVRAGKLQRAKCIGVTNDFFELNRLELGMGNRFHALHLDGGRPGCGSRPRSGSGVAASATGV